MVNGIVLHGSGLNVVLTQELGKPDTCQVYRNGRLLFDGVAKSALARRKTLGGRSVEDADVDFEKTKPDLD